MIKTNGLIILWCNEILDMHMNLIDQANLSLQPMGISILVEDRPEILNNTNEEII